MFQLELKFNLYYCDRAPRHTPYEITYRRVEWYLNPIPKFHYMHTVMSDLQVVLIAWKETPSLD